MGDTVTKFVSEGSVAFLSAGGGSNKERLEKITTEIGGDSYTKFKEILDNSEELAQVFLDNQIIEPNDPNTFLTTGGFIDSLTEEQATAIVLYFQAHPIS